MLFSITFKKMSQEPIALKWHTSKSPHRLGPGKPHLRVTNARIIMDRFEYRYPSDHFPYMVDLSTRLSP